MGRQKAVSILVALAPPREGSTATGGSIQSCLQNGWTLTFANRKPQAASSLLRRKKAIGVRMPEASLSEPLHAFLKMRDQVCLDLGIQTINDDTLEAYIARVQRACVEMREAVPEKTSPRDCPSTTCASCR